MEYLPVSMFAKSAFCAKIAAKNTLVNIILWSLTFVLLTCNVQKRYSSVQPRVAGADTTPPRSRRALVMIAFGPVPSRRLGRSLGINNVPPKVCTYSCVYCQLGRTLRVQTDRRVFNRPEALVAAVGEKVESARRAGERVDYLTFVPDGEPTLDANLGPTIRSLRLLDIPIAVISNGALLDREDVRAELAEVDWVSLKVDAVREDTWRRVDRPHRRLRLGPILDGMREFAAGFAGQLATETMVLAGLNDAESELRATAEFVGELRPATAYLAVPTRPPAEDWVRPASEAALARAYEVFRAWHSRVELLIGYEGDAFASTGDPRDDLLGITAVHPMREAAVRKLVERAGAGWALVTDLVRQGKLVEVEYGGHRYYLRPIAPRAHRGGGGAGKEPTETRARAAEQGARRGRPKEGPWRS
jgi:wyosine [tRNA(Phe)-imidazoG37] synthetase (radical SAM superfamily)